MNIHILSVRNLQKTFATIAVFAMVFSPFANVQFAHAAAMPNQAALQQWSDVSNDWQNGSLNDGNSNYSEGDVVPYRVDMTANQINQNVAYDAVLCRDYDNGTIRGFLNIASFDTSRAAAAGGAITSTSGAFEGVNVTINSVTETGAQGSCNAGERETLVNVTKTSATAYLLFGGYLAAPSDVGAGNGASEWPGASLHMKFGNGDRSLASSAIIPEVADTASITIKKDTNNAAGDAVMFDFTGDLGAFSILGDNGASVSSTSVLAGAPFTITESAETGWTFGSVSCTGDSWVAGASSVTVTPDVDESVTCTFVNNIVILGCTDSEALNYNPAATEDNGSCLYPTSGVLVVAKDVVGSDADESAFSFQIDGGSATAFETDGQNNVVITAGTYDVTEVAATGYTTSYDNCENVVVAIGATSTCTITNTRDTGSLTIYKETDDVSGDTIAFEFTGDAGAFDVNGNGDLDAQTGDYETFSDLPTGSYTITETDIADWTPGLVTCDVDSENNAKWSSTNGSLTIEIEKGDDISCAFTNTKDLVDDTTITINKVTNIESNDEFEFFLDDSAIAAATLAGGESSEAIVVSAGSHNIVEGEVAAWTLDQELSSCVITGTDDVVGSFDGNPYYLSLEEGDDVTCTFYNESDLEVIEMCKFNQNEAPVAGWGMTLSNGEEGGTYNLVTGENGCVSQAVDSNEGPWQVTEEDRAGWNFMDVTEVNGYIDPENSVPSCTFFMPIKKMLRSEAVAPDTDPTYNCSFYNEQEAPVCEIGNNLLSNASFEDPIADENAFMPGFWEIFAVVSNWTSSVNEIEIWNNMFGGASNGVQNVELDGDGNAPTTIAQTVATTPGAIYELRFDFSARPDTGLEDNSVNALADGNVVISASADGSEMLENDWTTYSDTFEATDSSTEIAFADVSTENENALGALIDNTVLCLVREPETPSYSQGSYGGGGNGTRVELTDRNDDDEDEDEPTPQVLGESTSVMPVGAPNTGAGGTSVPSYGLHGLLAILALRKGVQVTNVK